MNNIKLKYDEFNELIESYRLSKDEILFERNNSGIDTDYTTTFLSLANEIQNYLDDYLSSANYAVNFDHGFFRFVCIDLGSYDYIDEIQENLFKLIIYKYPHFGLLLFSDSLLFSDGYEKIFLTSTNVYIRIL